MTKRIIVIICCIFLFIGCNAKNESQKNQSLKNVSIQEEDKKNLLINSEREYDFNNYSTQGGRIYVSYIDNKLAQFKVYLLGERGKDIYEYVINKDKSINVLRNVIEYNQSIYEGDVEISTQEKTEFIIKKSTLYSVIANKINESNEKDVYEIYLEAIKTIK